MKKYGYFDWKNRKYVITNPKTPVKWINYIGTLEFGGFIDHTGGALLCKNDPAENRITKYIQQLPNYEFKGTSLYIRIKNQEGYRIFSPFFVPTLNQFQSYECHVCLGYSRIVSEMYGLKTDVTIFVPTDDKCEIRDITIKNISQKPLEIDLIPVIEYSHPQALKYFTNADWIPQTMTGRVIDYNSPLKILLQYPFMNRDLKVNYFTTNQTVSSFETDRKLFLGDNEYGTWMHPLALDKEELSNYEANRGDTISALMHHFGIINPDESKRLITQLGQVRQIDDARDTIEKYRNVGFVEEAFEKLKSYWNSYCEHFQVSSPDDNANNMLNIFNPYQCYITKTWSRYLSYYQMGYGARGIGFRDSSQDVLGILQAVPYEARDLIKDLLSTQWKNGSVVHQFNPLSKKGSIGDARESVDDIKYYGDDHLWIILSICEYLKETGDIHFLEEEVDYYDKEANGTPVASGTVFDHMVRAIEFTHENTGSHGLPLLGFADWNDTINLPAGSESFFIANLYGFALLNIIELSDYLNNPEISEKYRIYYDEIKQKVNDHGWDGKWYLRYFDNNKKALGTHKDSECICYCNAQSWSIISGFASEERALSALDAVYRLLNTEHGIKLSTKAYNGFDPTVGGITTYPPGAKENCGIFLHTNPWVILAETRMGNGERAFKYYSQINPAKKNNLIDTYEVEPYVYAQNILADEHPQFGLGRNSWLSGTASWVYHVATKYILGIRPEHAGLLIDPCIPGEWDKFSVKRIFRGSTYRISISNPHNLNRGVKTITVNGKKIEGNIIPQSSAKNEYTVHVVIGS